MLLAALTTLDISSILNSPSQVTTLKDKFALNQKTVSVIYETQVPYLYK